MTNDEISHYLSFSPAHSMVLALELSEEFPGFVRSLELYEDLRVALSIEPYGFDEAGAYFWGQYSDLETALRSLAEYLKVPIGNLGPCHDYPRRPENLSELMKVGHRNLNKAIQSRGIPFPAGASFLQRGTYG